ncbi:ATP-grasp domain-containing protein [Candidatus Woesearchaeota archaeon]|nr:ATP-grasp domain-containing protein [Candidatus Woesearchaeota archaeon]
MAILKILITGAGAPGIAGTIYSLRQDKDLDISLIGTDIRDDPVGKYFLDKVYKVPRPSQEFIDKVFEICQLEGIQVILPQVTNELEWFAKYKDKFNSIGVKVLISDYQSLMEVNNKFTLLKKCYENNVDCFGKYFLVKSIDELKKAALILGYPNKSFVVKMPVSNGMRGLRIINSNFDKYENFVKNKPSDAIISFEELLSIFKNNDFPDLLVTEFFPGDEYTVDVLAKNGETIVCIPRIRKVIRTGITFEGECVNHQEIINYCIQIVKAFKLDYMVGFQFKIDENGKAKILESNPRIQGTMVAATFANTNVILGAVKQALYGNSSLSQKDIIWGTKIIRYFGAIGDNGKEVMKL